MLIYIFRYMPIKLKSDKKIESDTPETPKTPKTHVIPCDTPGNL